MTEILSLLVLESDPVDGDFLLSTLLQLNGYKVKMIKSLKEGLSLLENETFDLILTNLKLPDSQGLETYLEIIKKTGSIPIIIMGDKQYEQEIQEAIKLGAQDYLPKSDITPPLLFRMINYAIERNRLHEGLKALSFTDELTGLYNRRGFFTLLEQQIALSHRNKKGFFLFLIDLDYLKKINDTYGHLVGDRALIHLAQFLISCFRTYDIIGRIGGDEFAIMTLNTHQEQADYFKNHMFSKLEQFNATLHEPFDLSFSVGMFYYDGRELSSVDELFQKADISLYLEKRETHT